MVVESSGMVWDQTWARTALSNKAAVLRGQLPCKYSGGFQYDGENRSNFLNME